MPLNDTSRPEIGEAGSGNRAIFSTIVHEQPVWAGLFQGLRDALCPAKLPPLELTSRPIPVADRMASKTSPWAVSTATIVNGGLLAVLLMLETRTFAPPYPRPAPGKTIDLSGFHFPLSARPKPATGQGGGGGGDRSLLDAIRGRNPRFETEPIVPPQAAVLERPQLPLDSAIAVPLDLKVPDNASLPNLGVHQSPNVTLSVLGPGTKAGIGAGNGHGDGPGDGDGMGPGRDHGAGVGFYVPGGDVSAPVPVFTPEAEFSDEARREKYQGSCMISVIIDAQGNPQNPRVTRHLGMGLDEKAMDAVMKYRFKPAKKNGRAVPVLINVLVDFRLY